MGSFFSKIIADKIINALEPKIKGQFLIASGQKIPITDLYKDDEDRNGKFKVMVGTGTADTEEIKTYLYSSMQFDILDNFDWELGEERKL